MLIRQQAGQSGRRREGFVILAVLMVITVLSLAAYQYSDLMSAEAQAADRIRRATEAKALADSGIHTAMALLADSDAFQGTLNKNPFDNPNSFQGIVVKEGSGRSQGRFSVVSPDFTGDTSSGNLPLRYGVIDEGGKLNINALYALDSSGKVLHDALMKLPNMTDDIAWSIVDWVDPDDEANAGGAESQYYASRTPPYQCKNAPLDTLEELLLVKGVTPSLLFGSDRNRNGKNDPGEDDSNGFTLGWINFLTVYSRELNVDNTGAARVNLNGTDLTQLNTDLTAAVSADAATLIIAYRLYGSSAPQGMGMGGAAATPQPKGGNTTTGTGTLADLRTVVDQAIQAGTQPKQRISSISALINAEITISLPGRQGQQARTVKVKSPLSDPSVQADVLPKLFDKTTTQAGTELPGRVNVNTAPREVLLALPGLADGEVDAIMAKRPTYTSGEAPEDTFATLAWLVSDNTIKVESLQSLERYATARTQVYRVQSIGYFDEAGAVARVEAVIDANQGKPRLVYYRDLTELGRGIDPRNSNR